MHCRYCEGFGSGSEGVLIDHLRMEHPIEVENEELPTDAHYTDPSYARAQQIVFRWNAQE